MDVVHKAEDANLQSGQQIGRETIVQIGNLRYTLLFSPNLEVSCVPCSYSRSTSCPGGLHSDRQLRRFRRMHEPPWKNFAKSRSAPT